MHRLVRVDCAGVLSRHMECRNILTRRLCAFIRIALLAMYSAQLPAIATRLSSGRLRRLRRRIAECSFTCITLGAGLELIRVRRIRVLTNHPRKVVALEGYGLEIADQVPLSIEPVKRGHQVF